MCWLCCECPSRCSSGLLSVSRSLVIPVVFGRLPVRLPCVGSFVFIFVVSSMKIVESFVLHVEMFAVVLFTCCFLSFISVVIGFVRLSSSSSSSLSDVWAAC